MNRQRLRSAGLGGFAEGLASIPEQVVRAGLNLSSGVSDLDALDTAMLGKDDPSLEAVANRDARVDEPAKIAVSRFWRNCRRINSGPSFGWWSTLYLSRSVFAAVAPVCPGEEDLFVFDSRTADERYGRVFRARVIFSPSNSIGGLASIPEPADRGGLNLSGVVPIDDLKNALLKKDEAVFEAVANKGTGVFETLKECGRQVLAELKKG
jgi:hypothetical protein